MNRVISFASGKGGVGKTTLVSNLGWSWAKQGNRVLLIDGDWGLGKLSIALNAKPKKTIQDVLNGKVSVKDAVEPIAENLSLLASPSGIRGFEELDASMRQQLYYQIEELKDQYDLVLLDHCSGVGWGVLEFAAASHQHVIVTTTEPTSYTDAYAIIKLLSQRFSVRDFLLVTTMSYQLAETEVVMKRFVNWVVEQLGVRIELIGILPWEPKVSEAICRQKPFIECFPRDPMAERLLRLGRKLKVSAVHPHHGLKFFYEGSREQLNP